MTAAAARLGLVATRTLAGALGLLVVTPLVADDPFLVTPASGAQAVFASGDVEMKGGARVDSLGLLSTGGGRGKGHVVAGGSVRLSGKARVEGDARCGPGGEVRKDGTASVSGRVETLPEPPAPLALDLAALEAALSVASDNVRIPRTSLDRPALSGPEGRSLAVGDGDRLVLPEGTYLFDALRLEGSAVVTVRGRVRILVTGPIRLSGRSRLNPESGPFFLRLWSSGAELRLEGTSSLRAFVLAPRATAFLDGDTTLTGALRAAVVRLDGQARVTRLVEDGPPLAAAFTESGQPLEEGTVFSRPVRPEATPLPRVPLPEIVLRLDGASFRSGDLVTAGGLHRLVARLRDTWGRDAEPSVSFRILPSGGEPPRVSIVSPAAGAIFGASPIDVSVRAGAAVTVDVNGIAATPAGDGFLARGVPLVEGTKVLLATGRDREGRVGTARSTVVLDTVPPAIELFESGLILTDGRLFARAAVPVVSVVEAHPGSTTATLDGAPFVPGTAVSSEGTHRLTVVAQDRAGNRTTRSVSFTVDTSPPALAITQPVPGSVVGELPAALSGTCGDAVRVSSAGMSVSPVNGAFTFPAWPFVEGGITAHVTAVDAAGNEARATAGYVVDVEAPAVAISSPGEGAILGPGPVFVRGTATDATLREVTVEDLPATVGSDGAFTAGPFSRPDGATVFTATASDAAGRTSTATVRVTVDTVPPVVTVRVAATGALLAPGALLASPPVLDVHVTDATTPAQTTKVVRVDGVPYGGGPVTGEGAHLVDVVATDGAGNVATASISFTLDTTRPAFRDLLPADGSVGRAATVTVSGAVSADAVGVTVNGLPASLAGGAFSLASVVLSEGENAVALRAVDGAGNVGTASLRLILDTIPPAISVLQPAAGALVGALTVTVSGTVSDPNLDTVTVDGGAAVVEGSAFRRDGVPLVEGANTLTATARDRAGNSASATGSVTADTKPPAITIGAPAPGAVLGVSPAVVSGSVTDAHLVSVTVNGVLAGLETEGRFRAEAPLSEGRATLTATARDALGHEAETSVSVTLDSAAPVVTIVSPPDGARFRTTPRRVVVRLASLENVEEVTVNGLVAAADGGEYAVDVPLVEGLNPLTARARKTTGKEGTASATVTLDTIPPRLVSSTPADGQGGVSLSPEIRLTFSEELDAATVIPAAVVLRAGSETPSPVIVAVEGSVVTVTSAAPLFDSRRYELALATSLLDLTGNALVPTTVRFSTVDLTAPEAPVLDPLPPLLCAVTKDVTGRAEPGATVVATGGAAVAQATVGAGGAFTVSVPLRAETHQTLSVVARDVAGNVSPAASVSLTTDCTPPHVVDVVRTATDLTVSFDEAIDAATLRAGDTVRLDETTGSTAALAVSLVLSSDGLVLTVTSPGRDLGVLAFNLSLSSGVLDLAGNALVPFVRGFAPLSDATVLVGELFDDATSRPLGNGSATLLVSGGVASAEPLPRASVTAAGLFALPAVHGEALVRLSAPGYLDVWRRASVVATTGAARSETLFDARLAPVAPAAMATPRDGGTLFTAADTPAALTVAAGAAPKVTLFAPGGALPPGVVATLTSRSAQGLPVLPPLGWSVAGAAHVRLVDDAGDSVSPSAPLTLRIPESYGASTATPLTLARLDATGLAWVAEGTASLAEGALEAFVSRTGDWAVFVPDPSPTAPPAPSPGAPLEGTILPASDPLEAATVVASPADVLASQTAEVSLTVSSALPVPSGFPIQCLVTEELTLLDGSSVAAPSFLSDLLLQRRGDGTTGLSILVRASEMARRAALSIGWERFAVKRFPFEVRQGSVVTPAGGSVPGPAGWSLGMPEGAVAAPVSVTLTPLAPTDLPVAIPEGFTLLGSVRVGSGGAVFSLPAALSVELAAPPPAGQDVLLVALEERAGLVVPRPVARAAWDEATSRLATRPIDRALFPWPGVRGDGTYAFVASSQPLAFVSGRLFGLDGAPLPNLDVRVAGWPLVGVTEADGLFALAIRAQPETLGAVEPSTGDLAALTVVPPAPGAELVGVELRIVTTPPWVAAVTPATGATVLVHSRFTVEFSEPLDPLSVTPESVFLSARTGSGDAFVVAARMEASSGSRSVVVVPEATLPGNASLVLTLRSTLRDLAGRGLVDRVTRLPAGFVATFTTEDLTPPDGKPWLVTIGLPSGDPQAPTVEIVGGPGSVCPGCHVVAYNDTTQATAATDALSDGSFRLTLAAGVTDAIRIEIEKANGTKQTLPTVPFTGDGGRTAIVGAGGGTWQTPEGHRLNVPQGAFTAPVTVTTAALPRSGLDALVAPPRDVVWVDSFTLGMEAGGQPAVARAGFDLSFAAPPPAGATDQFLLAQVVEVFGEKRLMVVDLLSRSGDRLVTDRSGQALQALARQGLATIVDLGSTGGPASTLTVVPGAVVRPLDGFGGGSFDRPSSLFDGVVKRGTYALYNTTAQMAVVAGSFSGGTIFATSSESDFVFAGSEVLTRNLYRLVTPAGRPFTLTLRDVYSGLALFQGEVTPGSDPNQVTPVDPPIRLDPEPPAVLSASPALVHRFLAPPAVPGGAGTDIAPRIKAESTVSGSHVRVTLTGAPGAVSPGAVVRLLNVSAEPGEPGAGEAPFTTAGPDGAFAALGIEAIPGDRLSLAVDSTDVPIGAPIVVRFDRLVKSLTSESWGEVIHLTPTDGGARPLELRFEPEEIDGATLQVTAIPEAPLERGRKYTLSVEGASDTGRPGKQMTARFEVGLGSPAPEPVATETTGFVRKVLAVGGLLFETGESNDIRVRDISLPPSGSLAGPCASVPLPGPGRDLALDVFGRLVCVGGGTDGYGFLKVFDILPGSGCANRLDEAGAAVVATQLGGDNAEYPAGGIPRRVSFHQPIERETWVAGRTNPPEGYSSASPLGVRLPYDLSGAVPAGPDPLRPRMVKLTNVTTGESKTQRVAPGAPLALSLLRVSRGDLLALELGTFSIAAVDVLGYGLAVVDLEAVYAPGDSAVPSPADPAQAAKLLLAYDGRSSGGGLPCQPGRCDVFQRCAASGPTCELLASPPSGYDGLGLQPITSLVALADAVAIPKRKAPHEEFRVVGALNGYGLVALSVDLLARARPAPGERIRDGHVAGLLGHLPLKRPGVGMARAVGIAVAPGMVRPRHAGSCSVSWPTDASGDPLPRDLAFVAAGDNGVWVVDVSEPASMSIVGRLDTEGGALTVSVDPRRKLLYVGDAGQGVRVFDVSDPCGETAAGLANDPRLVAVLRFGADGSHGGVANIPVEIDPDTGFAYAAANQTAGTAGLLGTYTLAAPPLYAVADTDQNGSFEIVSRVVPLGVENPSKEGAFESAGIADPASDTPPWPPREDGTTHDACVPDHFRLLAFLPGGAGRTVEAEVTSTSPEGLDLFPTAPGFPKSGYTAERGNAVTLRRQGDDPAQPAFNRYLSDPIVVLADPRAQLDYVRTTEETSRPGFAGHDNPFACRNCDVAADVKDGLISEEASPAGPARRLELWSGDRIRLALAPSLKVQLPYLAEVDLRAAGVVLDSVRGDLTPGVSQRPVLSDSSVLGVSTHSLELVLDAVDAEVPGRQLSFVADRTFASQVLHDGPLGRNWDSALFERLRPLPSGNVDYYDGSGRRLTFEAFEGRFFSPAGVAAVLTLGKDGRFYLVEPDHAMTVFDEHGRKLAFQDRRAQSLSGPEGNRHWFFHDARGRLTGVKDDLGRGITLDYKPVTGRLWKIRDFEGRQVEYEVDAATGTLTDARGFDPGSPKSKRPWIHYTYEGAAGGLRESLHSAAQLETEVDGNGKVPYRVNWDGLAPGAVASVQLFADAGTTQFVLNRESRIALVTDGGGHITEYEHDGDGYLRFVTDPKNHQTEFAYLRRNGPGGVARTEGPLTLVKPPLGNSVELEYEQAARSRSSQFNLKKVTRNAMTGRTDLPLITEVPEYDGHNLPKKLVAADGKVTEIRRDDKGDPDLVFLPGTSLIDVDADVYGRVTRVAGTSRVVGLGYDDDPGKTGGLRLARVVGGESVTFGRDSRGNVETVTDGSLRQTRLTWNKLDQVEREERGAGASGAEASVEYDAVGLPVRSTVRLSAPDGEPPVYTRSDYEFDSLGRLFDLTSSDAGTVRVRYDTRGNLASVTDAMGGQVGFSYEARGLLETVTDPSGAFTRLERNANGTPESIRDPRGRLTRFVFDGYERVIGTDDDAGAITSVVRDAAGRVRESKVFDKDEQGASRNLFSWTTFDYDAGGRPVRRTRKLFEVPAAEPVAIDVVTGWTRDDAGRVTEEKDPLGRITKTEYDGAGRVWIVTDAAGNELEITYDGGGRKWKEERRDRNSDGTFVARLTEFTYDDQGRLWKVTAPGNRVTEYEHDGRGLRTKEIDPDGGITRFEHDLAGRLKKRTDPLGYVTRWDYDLRGKLLKVTDAKGIPTTYAWDTRGLLVAETRGEPVDHPRGTSNLPTWRFTYDARGNRETATDPNGTVQIFAHDDAGRLTGRTVQKAPGVGGVDATSFTLDVLGRPYAEWAQSGTTRVDRTRRFDSLDRVREETLRIGTGPQRSLGRTFDAADNPVSLTYPSGRTIITEPDPLSRLAAVRSAAGDVLVHYDDLGSRQLRKVLGNGLTEERQYDPSGWLEHLDVGPAANPSGTFSVTYGRNGRSLKTDVKRADLGKRHAYEYDAASRILREQLGLLEPPPPAPAPNPPEVENFLTLDGLLNIVTEERTEAGTTVTTSSTTNSRNQVTQWGSDAAAYDANGNVASFRGRTLHYDADNRLVSALLPGGGTYEVLRDASGRKVRETLTASGTTHAVDVVQDGDRTLETFAANEGVPLESLVYGRGIDEVVRADLDPDGDGTATTVIPIQDELGNVAYLTGPDGAVLERYDYETYGRFRVFAPDGSARTTSAFGWNRLFQGREYVAALEAYDFRNRHLLPTLGRFAQEDPLGYVDSLNLYQAFGGGWVNATDPWGLRTFFTADVGPGDVLPTLNMETGNTAVDAVLGVGNNLFNLAAKFVNAGMNFGKGAAVVQDKVDEKAWEKGIACRGCTSFGIEMAGALSGTREAQSAFKVLGDYGRALGARPPPKAAPPIAGETESTRIGREAHGGFAEADRASGLFSEVSSPITDKAGRPIQVPKRVDLKTGQPQPGTSMQEAVPDAVSYDRFELVLDYKPLGRPIAKDRQEIIRFIKAYEAREGRLPKRVAIPRYDPRTGDLLKTDLFAPGDFLPK